MTKRERMFCHSSHLNVEDHDSSSATDKLTRFFSARKQMFSPEMETTAQLSH